MASSELQVGCGNKLVASHPWKYQSEIMIRFFLIPFLWLAKTGLNSIKIEMERFVFGESINEKETRTALSHNFHNTQFVSEILES